MSTPGREEIRTLNISVASGSGTGSVTRIWAVTRLIRVIPPSESASYDVKFLDGDGDIVIYRSGYTGTFSELLEVSLGSIGSVQITNATEDGTYKIKFDMN